MKIDFEYYLEEQYVEEEQPLDDMISDGFNDWLVELEIDDIIKYGQKYAELVFNKSN